MRGTNYFAGEDVAGRYSLNRPYFHPTVIDRVARFLHLQEPLSVVLDVACGTGKSTVALAEITSRVVGVDSSAGMLSHSETHGRVRYAEAAAEDLPFEDGSFDLITVASAFHWFNRDCFLFEARRVLNTSGWLVVYDNRFLGKMKENAAFETWVRESYALRYPSPPRDGRPIAGEEVRRYGFFLAGTEEYANEVRFSVEELAGYLETHSNVIAVVEAGRESLEEAHEWLVESLRDLFPGSSATFEFGGDISYLKAV